MKTLIALLFASTLTLSVQAKETTVKFGIFIHNNWFSCDLVEGLTKSHVEKLGGQLVDVRCNGGLPYSQHLNVTAVIDSATSTDSNSTLSTITYNNRSNRRVGRDVHCALDVKIIDNILKGFEVLELEKRDTCWGSEGRYRYDLKLRTFN